MALALPAARATYSFVLCSCLRARAALAAAHEAAARLSAGMHRSRHTCIDSCITYDVQNKADQTRLHTFRRDEPGHRDRTINTWASLCGLRRASSFGSRNQ